jgi:hypothetical protein
LQLLLCSDHVDLDEMVKNTLQLQAHFIDCITKLQLTLRGANTVVSDPRMFQSSDSLAHVRYISFFLSYRYISVCLSFLPIYFSLSFLPVYFFLSFFPSVTSTLDSFHPTFCSAWDFTVSVFLSANECFLISPVLFS